MNHPMTQQKKQAAYDAWFVAEVDKGIADCDAGNVLSEEEVELLGGAQNGFPILHQLTDAFAQFDCARRRNEAAPGPDQ